MKTALVRKISNKLFEVESMCLLTRWSPLSLEKRRLKLVFGMVSREGRKLSALISQVTCLKRDSIYYNVVASSENHFKAFFKLAELSETEEMNSFARFPLCTTFVLLDARTPYALTEVKESYGTKTKPPP